MAQETRKSITKELDVCHDCAEYGGHFCDECLDEIKKMKQDADRDKEQEVHSDR